MNSLPDAFAPLSQAFAQDPYPAYAALRAQPGPTYFADVDMWLLSRADDVMRVIQDTTLMRGTETVFSPEERRALQRAENFHDIPHHERFVQNNLLESDGPTHARLRRQVFRTFTPGLIARQRPMIDTHVSALIDRLEPRGEFDFIADFAVHIPGHVIGRVIGVPDADCPRLRVWSEETVRFFDIDRTPEKKARAEAAVTEFYHYLLDLTAERQKSPREDVLSALIASMTRGDLSEDELIATCMLILMAGHGSTIDVLGTGLLALLEHPKAMATLRADPSTMQTTIQEMFRFQSPLPFFHRYVTKPCEIAGQQFQRGDRIGVLYGAANRDEFAFDAPDTFDIHRSPNRHLAFGGGAHFCLGNHLARLTMDVVFTQLLSRFMTISLSGNTPEYKTGLSVRGLKSLNISLR